MSEEEKEDLQGIPKLEQPGFQEPSRTEAQTTPPPTDPMAAIDPIQKKKKRKLVILLSTLIPAGAIILAAVLVLVLVVLPEIDRSNRYDAGMKAYEAGNYSTAVEAFANLPQYKESAKYHELAAVYVLKEEKKYAEAKTEFSRLGLNDEATECDYLAAIEMEKAGKNKEAYDAYIALKDYKDSKARVTAIQDNVVAALLTEIKAIKAPTNAADFPTVFKSLDDMKAEATKFASAGRVATAANGKKDELLPAYAKVYFDSVLAGKKTNNNTYVLGIGVTPSSSWGNLKKLITQRFDVCPDSLCIYHKVTGAIKNKPFVFRYYRVDYNDSTQAFDKETLVDESNEYSIKNGAKEWVYSYTLKGTYKGEAYDIRNDRFPPGIYHMKMAFVDSDEVIASVYIIIGIK